MASSAKKRSKGSKASNGKRKRRHSGSEEDEPAFLSSKYAEPPTSKIYNSRFIHKDPAELFRKDLISAMKLPDSEPLSPDEYLLIEDSWKPEWERGVQVPIYPDALPEPAVRTFRKKSKESHFKLPKKLIRFTRDHVFDPEIHVMSYTNTLAERTCRYDMDDTDLQWLALVNEEREDFGLQPLEDIYVEQIFEEFEVQSYMNFQEVIKSEEGLGNQYDEDAICDVCRSPDYSEGNEMVFCDSCNICVHQICYGITKIPDGSWICRTCALGIRPACVLCPNRGGAMKTTRCGQKWAHVGCAVWIPEVSFFNFVKMEPITKISHVPPSRWALVCSLCKEKHGACIQCSEKNCKTAFHVTCAFQEGLQMRASVKLSDSDDDTLQAFCKKHSQKKRSNILDSDEDKRGNGGDADKRDSLSSEERANIRQQKIQAKEAEFYNYVNIDDVAHLFQYDRIEIELIFNYWKLKRRAGWNRAMLPPKIDTDSNCVEEDSPFGFLKKLVHHRQDLERARNLCYMVSKREKFVQRWIQLKELIFLKQVNILEKSSSVLSDEETEVVLNANLGDLSYDKKHTGMNGPSPNVARVLATLVGEEAVKIQPNGVMKSNRKCDHVKSERTPNPYAKHYLNGLLKRSQRWFASVDKQRKVSSLPSDADMKVNPNLNFQSSSDHVVSDDGFESSKDMHDLNLDHKSVFMTQVEQKFECFNANDNAFVNLETYHSSDALRKESDSAEECVNKEEISFPKLNTFCQSSNDSSFVSPSKYLSLDESASDVEIKTEVKSEDDGIFNEECKPSGLELLEPDFMPGNELITINSSSELIKKEEKCFKEDTDVKFIDIKSEDVSNLSNCELVVESSLERDEDIKFNLDIPIESCIEIHSEESSALEEIIDNINAEIAEIVIPGFQPKLEESINFHNDKKLNSTVHCVIVKSDIPLLNANSEIMSMKVKSPESCDKSVKSKVCESNSSEKCTKTVPDKSLESDVTTKDVKIRPVSSKASPLRTQSPTAMKVAENGLIKSSKSSPKQSPEKSQTLSKSSAAPKSKSLTNSHPVSCVNKQHTSSSFIKCQDKNSSKSSDHESAETKDSGKMSATGAPIPRKDMLRGYKIPKKPKTEKPVEDSLDLKRGNTPLSPLPDITSTGLPSYQTQGQSCWRKMEPRTKAIAPNPNPNPRTNMNGNIQQQSSERLVLKLKKDTTDPEAQRWKTDPNNYNRNNMCGWIGDFPPMHPRMLPPPLRPPFLGHPPPRWPRMRSRGGYRQIHMGYGNGPYT